MSVPPQEGRELKSYWSIVRRWLWLIALLVVTTLAVVYFRATTAPPSYQASITLQVIALEPEEVALYTQLRGLATDEQIRAVRDEFVTILESPTIAWRTVGELELDLGASELLDDIAVRAEDEFVTVQARAASPEAAEALVTTHVEKGLQFYREVRARPAETTALFIAEQLQESKENLADAEQQFLEFKLKHRTSALSREISGLQDSISALSLQRDEARVETERSLAVASEREADAAEAAGLAEAAEEDIQPARDALRQAELALVEITVEPAAQETTAEDADTEPVSETTEAQKAVEIARDQLTRAEAMSAHYRQLQRTLETEVQNHSAVAQGARTAEAEYGEIIVDREAQLAGLIGLSAEYDTLESNLQEARDRVNFLASKLYEAEVKKSQALGAGYLQIIEPAHTPGSPLASNTWQLLALGAVVSAIVGMILAFVFEALTNRRRRLRQPAADRRRQPRE